MNNLKRQLFYLVEIFVTRQAIVKKAMQELRPDLLLRYDKSISTIELIEIAKAYLGTPFRGVWQDDNDWNYYIHGAGCRLTNMDTGEPLEWAAPNLDEFYDEWFLTWLNWYVENHEASEEIQKLQNMQNNEIRDLLLELEKARLITSVKPNHFRLIVKV